MKATKFVGRKQFDRMIDANPNFMANDYPKLGRRWSLAGVEVSADESQADLFEQFWILATSVDTQDN